jgi:uncharacterized membrane protein
MQLSLTSNQKRIESIDLLRGLVMIIMALDHTRDFFHIGAFSGDPLDPSTTTPILYFTRWITHFCAPTFVFLSGLSAWLQSGRKTTKELSRFLITRGLWLILMEVTVITFGVLADIQFSIFMLQTIWSIGISMVILGLVIWLPFKIVLAIGLLIVFGHNAMDFAEKARQGNVPVWWSFLHRPAFIPLGGGHSLGIFYPFLPWTGLMILGYCCGKIFTTIEPIRRNKILLWMGVGLLVFFAALRATNIYGDPGHWTEQKNGLATFFAFMNVQKYPPSLLYMSATIGGALIFLALVKNTWSRLAKIISVYGRVPFFYYILHFYLLHIISIGLYLSRGHTLAEGAKGLPGFPFKFAAPGEGYSLAIVYGIWIAVVIALYPLCKWYDRYKTNHKEKWWLSYL